MNFKKIPKNFGLCLKKIKNKKKKNEKLIFSKKTLLSFHIRIQKSTKELIFKILLGIIIYL